MVENNIEQLSEMVNLNKDIEENPKIEVNNIKNKVNKINKNINDNISLKNAEQIENINKQIEDINNNQEVNIPIIRNTNVNKNKLFNPIGILDPEGKELNPLTGEQYKNLYTTASVYPDTYVGYAKYWSTLPTYGFREEIINKLYNNQCILVTAGTGSGKTVLIPKFLLHVLNYQGKIAITIPRIAPTKSAGEYAAKTLDTPLGEQVGYSYKGKKIYSKDTKLLYLTDGTILSKLNGTDPNLDEFDALIIDEAHERNPNIDQILLLIKQVLANRPKFKLLIMSATINPELFLNYYKDFGIKHIDLPEKSYYPVDEIFLKKAVNIVKDGQIINKEYINKAAEIIFDEILLPNKVGDILVLISSPSESVDICRAIENLVKDEIKKNPEFSKHKPFCIGLSAISDKKSFKNGKEKNYAVGNINYKKLNEGYTRRIIIANEVAESSITFEGDPINFVIDTGLSNTLKYYPNTEYDALERKYIAQANHIQRKGRTGRKQAGVCYNVFTEDEYKKFLKYPIPKLLYENIIDIILTFLLRPNITHIDLPFNYPKNKNSDIRKDESLNSFLSRFIDPPHVEYVSSAIKQLFLIGAIEIKDKNKGYVTLLGRAINLFNRDSISPQKAAAIIEAFNYRCADEVINIMTLLTIVEDKFEKIFMQFKPKAKNKKSKEFNEEKKQYDDKIKKLTSPYGDHISLYYIMKKYKEKNYTISREDGREVLISKETGEGTQWARDNNINASILKNAIDASKDIKRSFGMSISMYKRDNPEKANDRFIFKDNIPNVHDKIEDNIMQAITKGFIGNIVKKVGRNYSTCFPEVQSIAEIDRDSLFKNVSVKPMNCLFGKFMSIFGSKKFQIFSKVPIKVIENLSSGMKEDIKKCAASSKETEPKKFNKGFSGSKNKWKGSKGSKGKFKGSKDSKGKFKGSKGKEKKYKDKRN